MTAPLSAEQVAATILEYGNAAFACGEYSGDEPDEYHALNAVAELAKQKLLDTFLALAPDAARYRWALPILSGDYDAEANAKALVLAGGLMGGKGIDEIIDAARGQP